MEDNPVHNSDGIEASVTTATTDGDQATKQGKKLPISPNSSTAVVNRLKSLLSRFKGKTAEQNSICEESSVTTETCEYSSSACSGEADVSNASERPRVPLKERSFLHPFLELTASAQGTTEEEVIRRSPDLFQSVKVKMEKADDVCSQSSIVSRVSDAGSDVVSIKGIARRDPWKEIFKEHLASENSGSRIEDTSSDVEICPVDEAVAPVVSERPSFEKKENIQRQQTSYQPLPLASLLAGIIDETMKDGKNTASSVEPMNDKADNTYSGALQSLDEFVSSVDESGQCSKQVIPSLDPKSSDGTPTEVISAGSGEKFTSKSEALQEKADACIDLKLDAATPVKNIMSSVECPPLETVSPDKGVLNSACGKSHVNNSCPVSSEEFVPCGDDKSAVSAQTAVRVCGVQSGLNDLVTDKRMQTNLEEEEKPAINEEALKNLRAKFPLLWEAASKKGEADVQTANDDVPLGEEKKIIEESVSSQNLGFDTISVKSCESMSSTRGAPSEKGGRPNVIFLDDPVHDSLEDRSGVGVGNVVPVIDDGIPPMGLVESDCSNEKISKVSISDDSDVVLLGEEEHPSTNRVVNQMPVTGLVSGSVGNVPGTTSQEQKPPVVNAPGQYPLIPGQVSISRSYQEQHILASETQNQNKKGESGVPTGSPGGGNDSMGDQLSIKIAEVKTMDMSDFESFTVSEKTPTAPSPTPSNASTESRVVTVLSATGQQNDVKPGDVIIKCKFKDGKYRCLLCKFSISFATSFSLHLYKHLHLSGQACGYCGASEKLSPSISPFDISCPIVKATIDALEKARLKETSQNVQLQVEWSKKDGTASPLLVLSTPDCALSGEALEAHLSVLSAGKKNENRRSLVGLVPTESADSEDDCTIISAVATGEREPVMRQSSEGIAALPNAVCVEQDTIGEYAQHAIPAPGTGSISSSDTRASNVEDTVISNILKLEKAKGFYTCGFLKCGYSTSIDVNLGIHYAVAHSFEQQFPCVYCGYSFDYADNLIQHMKGHQNASKMFQLYCCSFKKCRFCTNNSSQFRQHLDIMHSHEKDFNCEFCKDKFSRADELIQHLNANLLKLTQCPYCLVRSPSRPQVLQHIKRQHQNEVRRVTVTSKAICLDMKKKSSDQGLTMTIHKCSICGFFTSNAEVLKKHIAKQHEKGISSPSADSPDHGLMRQKSNSDQSHKSAASMDEDNDYEAGVVEPGFACHFCQLTFKSNNQLTKHLTEYHKHSSPRSSIASTSSSLLGKKTPEESRSVTSNETMDLHSAADDLDCKFFKCMKCEGYSVKSIGQLRKHMLTHPGKHVAPQKGCRHCAFIGPSTEAVLLHDAKSHIGFTDVEIDDVTLIFYGEKAACPVCDYKCAFRVESIVNHMMKEHAGNHSALKEALEQLPDEGDSTEKLTHLEGQKFFCKFCTARFGGLSQFLNHSKCHFTGERTFIIYKCIICHIRTDNKRFLNVHYKRKHAAVVNPPDYIRYIKLRGTLKSAAEGNSSTSVSECGTNDQDNNFGLEIDDVGGDPGTEMHEDPGFDPQDEADVSDTNDSDWGVNASTSNQDGDFLVPAAPVQMIKKEPGLSDENTANDHDLKIERYHCDYCTFSTDDTDEYMQHQCEDENREARFQDYEPDIPFTEENEDSSSSEAAQDDDFVADSSATSKKVGNEWECVTCGYRAQHRNKIERHYRYKHQVKRPYICGYCNFSAVENGHVRRHCRHLHPNRPVSVVNTMKADQDEDEDMEDNYEVDDSTTDVNPSDLAYHITQLGAYVYQCNICKYTQETRHLIERHVLCVHYKFHKYRCKYCSFTAAEKGKMIKHCKKKHDGNIGFSIKKFEDTISQEPSEAEGGSPLGEDMSLKRKSTESPGSPKKKLKTDKDGETTLDLLTRFYTEVRDKIAKKEEPEKAYHCGACSYSNPMRWCVVRHVSNYHPEGNDFDLVCESSSQADQRKAHICKECNISMESYFDVKKHVLGVHYGIGLYNCKYCSTRMNSKNSLWNHLKKVHPNEPQEMIEYPDPLNRYLKMDRFCVPQKQENGKYKCTFCQHNRSSLQMVEKHLKRVHLYAFNPFKCIHCGYSSTRRDTMKMHHSKWHPNEDFAVILVRAPDASLLSSPHDSSSPTTTRRISCENSASTSASISSSKKRKRSNEEGPEGHDIRMPTLKLVKYIPGREAAEVAMQEESASNPVKKTLASPKKLQPLKIKLYTKGNTSAAGRMSSVDQIAEAKQREGAVAHEKSANSVCAKVNGPVDCPLCGRTISSPPRLRTHLMVHLDYRPYKCTQPNCKARFIEIHSMRKHGSSLHNVASKYKLQEDEKLSARLEELIKVACTESSSIGVKSVKIENIEEQPKVQKEEISPAHPNKARQYARVEGPLLDPIEEIRNGVQSFCCPHCEYFTCWKKNIYNHINRHGPYRYKCQYCDLLGYVDYEINRHSIKRHGKMGYITLKNEDRSDAGPTERLSVKKVLSTETPIESHHSDAERNPIRWPGASSAEEAWRFTKVVQLMGSPRSMKRGKMGGNKKWKCPACPFSMRVRCDVLKHMEKHLNLSPTEGHTSSSKAQLNLSPSTEGHASSSKSHLSVSNKGDMIPESPKRVDAAKLARWTEIVRHLGVPKAKNSGLSFSRKWRCPKCALLTKSKNSVMEHMVSHLDEEVQAKLALMKTEPTPGKEMPPCPNIKEEQSIPVENVKPSSSTGKEDPRKLEVISGELRRPKSVTKPDGSIVFKCHYCPNETNSLRYANNHLLRHKPRQLKCGYCTYLCYHPFEIKKHSNVHHGSKPLKWRKISAELPPQTSIKPSNVQSDPESEAEVKSEYRSPDKRPDELPCNVVKEGVNTIYKCPECNYSSCIYRYFREHYNRQHKKKPTDVQVQHKDEMDDHQEREVKEHVSNKNKNLRYKCTRAFRSGGLCGRIMTTLQALIKHNRHTHGYKLSPSYKVLANYVESKPANQIFKSVKVMTASGTVRYKCKHSLRLGGLCHHVTGSLSGMHKHNRAKHPGKVIKYDKILPERSSDESKAGMIYHCQQSMPLGGHCGHMTTSISGMKKHNHTKHPGEDSNYKVRVGETANLSNYQGQKSSDKKDATKNYCCEQKLESGALCGYSSRTLIGLQKHHHQQHTGRAIQFKLIVNNDVDKEGKASDSAHDSSFSEGEKVAVEKKYHCVQKLRSGGVCGSRSTSLKGLKDHHRKKHGGRVLRFEIQDTNTQSAGSSSHTTQDEASTSQSLEKSQLRFKCNRKFTSGNYCPHVARSLNALKIHHRARHGKKRFFYRVLGQEGDDNGGGQSEEKHVSTLSSEIKYQCEWLLESGDICGHETMTKGGVKKHYYVSHGSKDFQYKTVDTGDVKDRNQANDSSEPLKTPKFQCTVKLDTGLICGHTTQTLRGLQCHHQSKHYEIKKPFQYKDLANEEPVSLEKIKPKSGYSIPEAPEADSSGVYRCSQCPTQYEPKDRPSFFSHWRAHFKGYTCTICGQIEEWPSWMERHVKRCHNETDYAVYMVANTKPEVGDKGAVSVKVENETEMDDAEGEKVELENEIVVPKQESRSTPTSSLCSRQAVYKCSKCTHTSYTELDHALHVSTHSSGDKESSSRSSKGGWMPRPYECGYCNKGFFVYSKAKNHLASCHPDQPLKIEQIDESCGKSSHQFSSRSCTPTSFTSSVCGDDFRKSDIMSPSSHRRVSLDSNKTFDSEKIGCDEIEKDASFMEQNPDDAVADKDRSLIDTECDKFEGGNSHESEKGEDIDGDEGKCMDFEGDTDVTDGVIVEENIEGELTAEEDTCGGWAIVSEGNDDSLVEKQTLSDDRDGLNWSWTSDVNSGGDKENDLGDDGATASDVEMEDKEQCPVSEVVFEPSSCGDAGDGENAEDMEESLELSGDTGDSKCSSQERSAWTVLDEISNDETSSQEEFAVS